MKHYLFLITKDEHAKGNNGWKFIKENEDRLIPYEPDVTDMDSFFTTMEREVFHIVKDDVVYATFKNYLDITNNRRIFVMVDKERESDIYIKPEEDTETEPSEGEKEQQSDQSDDTELNLGDDSTESE